MGFLFPINVKVRPSHWFIGILAEMNGVFTGWSDGSYDWAAQYDDFLYVPSDLPSFDDDVFKTTLSKCVLEELLEIFLCLISGENKIIQDYLAGVKFAFVIGYPRSGGSYLTKELFRSIGIDHARVSEALAHDGFPDIVENWFGSKPGEPYFYLQESMLQLAEFLVLSKNYFSERQRAEQGRPIIIPKKMHKLINWAGSLRSLLGGDLADYIVTIRNPLPTAISIYEKSFGMPADGKFPALGPRSAIEKWILNDLTSLGFSAHASAALDYFEAVQISWTRFHTKLADSGLFAGDANDVTVLPYDPVAYQEFLRRRYAEAGNPNGPEPLLVHDKYRRFPEWSDRADGAIASMRSIWRDLGLRFPHVTNF